MSKKRKGLPKTEQPGSDKPDWARDLFHDEKPRKPAKQANHENDVPSLKERLQEGVVAKLDALKAEMTKRASAETPGQAKKQKPAPPQQRLIEDDGDASFAELFNPAEPDEDSFEKLLDTSKLDWRSFKK